MQQPKRELIVLKTQPITVWMFLFLAGVSQAGVLPLSFTTVLVPAAIAQTASPDTGINPRSYSPDPMIDKLIRKELALEDAGNFEGALSVNKTIVDLDPQNVYVLNTMAGLYGKVGSPGEEISWAKRAIAADPKYALSYINYGTALATTGKASEAEISFKKAVTLDPKLADGYYSLGVLADQEENFTKAVVWYQKAVQVQPDFAPAYFNLAMSCANLKQFDAASIALRNLLKLTPDNTEAKSLLSKFEELSKAPKP